MAKVKITGHASGTGILTVTAPNTSTDRTITLPDATGTLATTTGTTGIQNAAADADTIWIDANENVGIGQAPEAWRSAQTSLDIGDCTAISSHTSSYSYFANNYYHDGAEKYKNTGAAALMAINSDGSFVFDNAPSGSADAAITLTNRLEITADGRGKSQFTAKAWCNFTSVSTTAVQDSHNVSSVTDRGTGWTQVNYTNNMANANYAAAGMSGNYTRLTSDGDGLNVAHINTFSLTGGSATTTVDESRNFVIIFGD